MKSKRLDRPYPMPPYEQERLTALYSFDILDTLPEVSFDNIAAVAAHLFRAPISLISFVDDERQWFKAKCGLDATETDRQFSFCTHAMLEQGPLVICDATNDLRFKDNPLVTGDMSIRFYVGAPLKTSSGLPLGSLCVIDTVVRESPDRQTLDSLANLAHLVVQQLELRLAVAARTKAQHEQRMAEQRYQSLAEASRDLFVVSDAAGTVLTVNRAANEIFGYQPAELIGQPVFRFIPGFPLSGTDGVFETLGRHKSGAQVPLEVSFNSIDSDRVFTAVARDMTARNKHLKALKDASDASRANEARLNEAQHIARLGSFEWDQATDAINWSDEIYRLFGLPLQSKLSFRDYRERLTQEDRSVLDAAVGTSLKTGESYHVTHPILRHDGSVIYLENRGRVERDSADQAGRLLGTLVDVTERVQSDLLLKNSNDELQRLLNEKETLLKEIHHRVKNNLQIVSSLLKIQASSLQDHDAVQALNDSQRRVMSMALVHERLYGNPQLDEIDFGEYAKALVRELLSSYAGIAARTVCRLETANIVFGIHHAIPCGLMLNELVTNALKYAYPDGGGEILIEVSEPEPGRVRLAVSDQGVGLPEGFNWQRSGSMGMSLVGILTNQIGGTLTVRSQQGAAFTVEFPMQKKRA